MSDKLVDTKKYQCCRPPYGHDSGERRRRCAYCGILTYHWEKIGSQYNCWYCGKKDREEYEQLKGFNNN